MKTPNLKLYLAPVALLVMASALAVQPASAEARRGERVVQATYAFNPEAPATEIHAGLKRVVERLCRSTGPRAVYLRMYDRTCMTTAMKDGIARIGRQDVAALETARNG